MYARGGGGRVPERAVHRLRRRCVHPGVDEGLCDDRCDVRRDRHRGGEREFLCAGDDIRQGRGADTERRDGVSGRVIYKAER